jgi:hypothetical protein
MCPDNDVSGPSMGTAVERMLSASQQLVADRIDLLLLDAKDGLARALEAGAAAGIAAGAFFCGWLCINAAAAAFFRETLSLPGILTVLAAVNVGIAAFGIMAARQIGAPKQANGGRTLRGS